MAACRVAFTWLGTQKSLTPEQPRIDRQNLRRRRTLPQRRQETAERAPCHGMSDPQVTWEGLSAMPLGHRTHLAGKPKGDNRMFGKPGDAETTEASARRDPDGMAKPGLAESQCPPCKAFSSDTVVEIRGLPWLHPGV